jgi:hypothetical protein
MLEAMKPLIVVLLLALTLSPASADDWPGPQTKEVFSASRDYFVRVTPGSSIGDTKGFAGAAKGKYATAEFYRRNKDRSYELRTQITLANPVAPVDFFVANDGQLITLDNWHNLGYGKIVVVYAPDGTPTKSYALNELFLDTEVDAFPHSISSIHWREGPIFFQINQKTLLITTKTGASLEIEAQTGAFQYCETITKTFRCRETNQNRKWRPYRQPS